MKGVYQFLCHNESESDQVIQNITWNMKVSLKVCLYAWRIVNNTLPTKDNLTTCEVFNIGDFACLGGCGSNKVFLGTWIKQSLESYFL